MKTERSPAWVLVWIMASAIIILSALLASALAERAENDTQEIIGQMYGMGKHGYEGQGWHEFSIKVSTEMGTDEETNYWVFVSSKEYNRMERAWNQDNPTNQLPRVRVRFVQSVEDVVMTSQSPNGKIFCHAKTIELLDEK